MTTVLLTIAACTPLAAILILFARPARDYLRAVRTPEHEEQP